MKIPILRLLGSLLGAAALTAFGADAPKPNLLYILCDDLGYGDVHCLNAGGKIPTPAMDRLGAGGMIFTDAHSSSAVCTPTRYGILTGRYNWRSRLQSGVLGGLSPHLIEPGRLTVPALLRQHGYHTACIGKWHLGMDWALMPGDYHPGDAIEGGQEAKQIDFTKPIANGPLTVGFESYFGISASLDMVPYTFIENDRVLAQPTVEKAFPMMAGREPKKTTRPGLGAPDFEAVDVLPRLAKEAAAYLRRQKAGEPFFLYLPLNAPHTPILPTAEWLGKSGLNPYGDYVMETDAMIGKVLQALEESGLAQNTLVFLASDNGCSPSARFDELQAKGHFPSADFRGTKADIFDGGHRIPFVVRWPGHIAPGSHCDQTVCLTDLLATCAEVIGEKLPPNAGEDSVSLLPALLHPGLQAPLREAVVHHSINGSFAIRQGSWKLELCSGSGGWSAPRPGTAAAKALPAVQLYDLTSDVSERENVQAEHPEIVARLTELLKKYIEDGRSTPGPAQKNDVPIKLWKDQPGNPGD
jgi:arylsulfatase A-like enzyme